MLKLNKIFVTGGTGFIGNKLIEELLSRHTEVFASYRGVKPPQVNMNLTWIKIFDSYDWEEWARAFQPIDTVIHLAALAHSPQIVDETIYDRVNFGMTEAVAKAAHESKVRRLVFISSIGAMANTSTHRLTEKDECRPTTPYGRSKLRAELALKAVLKTSVTDYIIIRPTLVVGPGCPGNLKSLGRLIRGNIPLPSALGRARRSLVSIDNLTDALVVCASYKEPVREAFIFADDEVMTLDEICCSIAAALGRSFRKLPFPGFLLRLTGKLFDLLKGITGKNMPFSSEILEKLDSDLVVSNAEFKRVLKWEPRVSTYKSIGGAFTPIFGK